MTYKKILWLLFFWSVLCAGCKTSIAPFDQHSYTELSGLKVDVLNMMKKATDDYTGHEAAADALRLKVEKAYEYDVHKPKNEMMGRMWTFLYESLYSDKMEGLGERQFPKGFFNNWKASGKKSGVFVQEASGKIVGPMFDLLLELESKKLKPAEAETLFQKILNKLQ